MKTIEDYRLHEDNIPELSVIMGVYFRRENTSMLKRSVQSILMQTFDDFEFLICDDGSSQEAISLLNDLAFSDSRIKLLREGTKFTLPQKLNHCLKFAQGRYIARMDDDDYSLPNRFEKQLNFLHIHSDVDFVGCNVILVRDGVNTGHRNLPGYPTKEDFQFVQPYIHPTIIFKKTAIDTIGGYSEDKRQVLCEDYDLLLRLYEKGFRGSNLQEYLFEYTLPSKGKSSRKFRHRVNEAITRWERFKALNMLPKALPYVVKPLIVGLIPASQLEKLKEHREMRQNKRV